jgi:hypothetical protein
MVRSGLALNYFDGDYLSRLVLLSSLEADIIRLLLSFVSNDSRIE